MTTLYERAKAAKSGEVLFTPLPATATSGLSLSQPSGGYHFDPTVPAPPPPGGFFLPIPSGYELALQHNFTTMTALPTDEWTYAGRPGGTNNCEWLASQVTLDSEGVRFTTEWLASFGGWVSGAIGTQESWKPPLRFRVYQRDHDWNIDGLNRIDLAWTNPWFYECDFDEYAVVSGQAQPSAERIHNGNGANVVPPIYDSYTPDFDLHCKEMELVDSNYNTYRDGVLMGSRALASSDWTAICSQAKWIGIQDELYSIGTGNQSATSVRSIYGVEVLVPG